MQFLKKHYEKILLSLILLVLAVAAVILSIQMRQLRAQLTDTEASVTQVPHRPLPPINTSAYLLTLSQATNPPPLNITTQHLVFNPVKWYKKPDGTIIKVLFGNEVGVGALEVTKVTPLNLIISVENPTSPSENPRYKFLVERQAATNRAEMRKQFFTPAGGSNAVFVVKEVKGDKMAPTEISLDLLTEGAPPETITLSKDMPFTRVTDYSVEMRYPPENLEFHNRRIGDTIAVGNQRYNVIAITEKQVVLSAESNQKRTIVPYKAAP